MKFVLAPMAGFTDAAFRLMCSQGGADLTYTEMVSAAALAHGHSPSDLLLETMPGEGPVACQIFGAEPGDIAAATRRISSVASRFVELNLNAGCPMKKITACGAGAKLVEDPDKIARLIAVMKEITSLPVTLKTRLGPNPARTAVFDIIDAAQAAGVDGITLHARYTSQCHGGMVHLELLAEAVARARVPITGNGSVTDAKSAAEMAQTGVDALMIGRAALANPFVFTQLRDALAGRNESAPREDSIVSCARHLRYLLSFREQIARNFPALRTPSPDAFASVKMHTHLFRYFNGRPGAAAMRARLNSIRTLREINDIISASWTK